MGRIIAIDFDGVIHDHKHPLEGRRMGAPIKGAQDSLKRLRGLGHTIIVFSTWGDEKGQKTIADFMNYYSLPFDKITNIKPKADFYVDDHAVKFTNWPEICKILIS